jgi:hypothetical protein
VLHSIRSWSRDEVEMRTRRRSRGKKKKKKRRKEEGGVAPLLKSIDPQLMGKNTTTNLRSLNSKRVTLGNQFSVLSCFNRTCWSLETI